MHLSQSPVANELCCCHRLWYKRELSGGEKTLHKLHYLHVIPARLETHPRAFNPKFQTLDVSLDLLNEQLCSGESVINGRSAILVCVLAVLAKWSCLCCVWVLQRSQSEPSRCVCVGLQQPLAFLKILYKKYRNNKEASKAVSQITLSLCGLLQYAFNLRYFVASDTVVLWSLCIHPIYDFTAVDQVLFSGTSSEVDRMAKTFRVPLMQETLIQCPSVISCNSKPGEEK